MKPILLAAALSLVVASPLWSRTWEITLDGLGDAPTIQAGIDSAAAGDTVLVRSILEGFTFSNGILGISVWQASPSIIGNIMIGNGPAPHGGAFGVTLIQTTPGIGATPTLRNNLAWQNTDGDGVGTCPTWWQSDGNLVANPAFCDTTGGDFHLAQDSPAITQVAGPLGVYPIPGCGPVPVRPTTWGRLKTRYQ